MNIDCVEASAPFICLRVDKAGQISRPVPDKTFVIIVIGPLHSENGSFTKIDPTPGADAIISEKKPQFFFEDKRGGGIGLIMRIKYAIKSST